MENIINNISLIEKMYDAIRIVDPLNKKVIYEKGQFIENYDMQCYSFWKNEKICDNCISQRAYIEDKTFIKIEYNLDKIYMVMASPVNSDDKLRVIELLKDITNSGIIEDINKKNTDEISEIVSRMNEMVVKDELTGIYNRRYIDERLPVDILCSITLNDPISIAFGDIDFFKKINDTYGHIVGDYVLKEFANVIYSNIRSEQDWVGRFGGEEFLIIFKNCKGEDAYKATEKIRKAIEKKEFMYEGNLIKVTSSFGICTMVDNIQDYNKFIECADRKLYEAKNTGRNKTVI